MKPHKQEGFIRFMVPLVLGNMLNPLNSTMLATALVTICQAFGKEISAGALLIIPLYFTSAIGQPLMGRLADIYSARRVSSAGYALVLISAGIGITATHFNWLIVSRVLLGLGTSAAYPSSLKLIRERFEAQQQDTPGIALGIVAVAGQVSMVMGPFIGGMLTQYFSWQGIFYVNIPLAGGALLLSAWQGKNKTATSTHQSTSIAAADFVGIALFSGALAALLSLLLSTHYWWLKSIALLVLSIAFIRRELQHPTPFIDIRLFGSNLPMSITFIRQTGITFVMYIVLYAMPQWVEQTRHITPARLGLLMLPQSAAAICMSLLFARSKKVYKLLAIGSGMLALSTAGLLLLQAQSTLTAVVVVSTITGLTLGLLAIANQGALYQETPAGKTGISFGLYRTVGYLGAILSGVALKVQYKGGATDTGFHHLAGYALFSCVLVLLLLIPLYRRPKHAL
ncbi:MFS family permease [Filimonas zeae]|uniref:MFS transporter n=1 Tax=Filimonas zeae TaxID=1737353 RepID=A0A917J0C7_9BACT|nr:MFS transporter [Filimonas zeae]MDR6340659.1 MFS family permease [Filimonas zeae]GGH73765.1 MFS transporter [Filimonas zeae]